MLHKKYEVSLFLLPIAFQTVSFHHQSHYFITLTLHKAAGLTVIGTYKQQQKYQNDYTETLDHSGNAWNVGGERFEGGFRTNRFQINYNDQVVHFNAGVLIKLLLVSVDDCQPIRILFQLYKSEESVIKDKQVVHLKSPKDTLVADEELLINLGSQTTEQSVVSINNFFYRKIVFPRTEYISFLDISLGFTCVRSKVVLGSLVARQNVENMNIENEKGCCMVVRRPKIKDAEKLLKKFYVLMIEDKLRIYGEMRWRLIRSLKDYEKVKTQLMHLCQVTARFEKEFIMQEPVQLDYVSVLQGEEREQNMVHSNNSLKKVRLDYDSSVKSFRQVLINHYQCEKTEVYKFICEESAMIDLNIKSVFHRWTQLQFVIGNQMLRLIPANQIERMNLHIAKAQDSIRKYVQLKEGFTSLKVPRISCDIFQKYEKDMQLGMSQLTNLTRKQTTQPLILTLSEPSKCQAQKLSIDHTLTVFVHGYRGNEYDLSKMKSYLSLFFGFSQFYSIKNLNLNVAADQHISKLGITAAEQINKLLATNNRVKHINVVGFSLGGVIARAMLPHMQEHKDKFNLLVSLASPHLGIREIESCLVSAGLYYMRQVTQVASIRELCHEEEADDAQLMMSLSSQQYIRWFSWIIMVGSQDDNYVPIYSSLAQYEGDDEKLREMSNNLNSRIEGNVVKCLAKLSYKQSLWDLISKRRPHISFLEEDCFIRYFIIKFQKYFLTGKQKGLIK